ncbi:unnamed protein product [Closterium sp. Naga37s-1]|nr:unnamed protein product [Closterium sp. Naga37s-1]
MSFVKVRPIRWQHVATEASRGATRLVPVFPLRLYDPLLFSLRSIPPFHTFHPVLPNQQPDQCGRVSVGVRIQGVPVSTLATGPAAASGQGGSRHDGLGQGGSAWSALDREMERRLPGQLRRALLPFQREGVEFAVGRGGRCLIADEMGVGKTIQREGVAFAVGRGGRCLIADEMGVGKTMQREGVAFAVGRGGRCLIADEMGVGKTIQAIAAAAWYMAEGPLLIVCPACLRLQWAEQLERWLPFLRPSQIHIGKPLPSQQPGNSWRGCYELPSPHRVPGVPQAAVGRAAGEVAALPSPVSNPHWLQWAEQLERWLPFLRPSQIHIGKPPALSAPRLQWAEQLERWLPFLRPSQIHIVFGQRDDLVEEDEGERKLGAGTEGHLNGHTDKEKSTGEVTFQRQRDDLVEEDEGERTLGAGTEGHLNGHTDKEKSTGEVTFQRQRDDLVEEDEGERTLGAGTEGHLNGHTDKEKSTGEVTFQRQRDDLVEEDEGERTLGAGTEGHLNGHTDKEKSTGSGIELVEEDGGKGALGGGMDGKNDFMEEYEGEWALALRRLKKGEEYEGRGLSL